MFIEAYVQVPDCLSAKLTNGLLDWLTDQHFDRLLLSRCLCVYGVFRIFFILCATCKCKVRSDKKKSHEIKKYIHVYVCRCVYWQKMAATGRVYVATFHARCVDLRMPCILSMRAHMLAHIYCATYANKHLYKFLMHIYIHTYVYVNANYACVCLFALKIYFYSSICAFLLICA